ncbi:MAG TPA: peptidylprolyl isomerase [Burkholderiaceae bacterium]|nr:peptidylprolyl isomerase [Burkholderiaceae bacterium]
MTKNLRACPVPYAPGHLIGRFALACTLLLALLAPLTAPAQGLRPSGILGSSAFGSSVPGAGAQAARAAPSGPRQADFIVVVVNSEPITNNEVLAKLVRAEQQLAQQGGAMPPRDVLARQVLDRMINEMAQLQLAREAGVKVDDAAVDQAEANIANQNQITVADLRRRLNQDGLSVNQFRADLRDQILLTRIRERELEPRARVTETDIDQFIAEKQGLDASNAELSLAMVLVAVPENAEPAQLAALKARAEEVTRRARAGQDFTALVREFSDAPDRSRNDGNLGLRTLDRFPELFVDATRGLPKNGVSDPVRSGAGFHVLKVLDRRQGSLPAMTVTQSRARHILLRPSAQLTESAAAERLADFRRRIMAGQADFATLARENSQDGSAREGGDLGWVSPGQFVPEFEEVMNKLAPGQISQPVVSRFGVHLIQLMERRDTQLSPREQREIVRGLVREKKFAEAYQIWAQDVRGRAYVEFREPPQ